MRIGHGYDAHKLVKGSHVVLGGIKIDSEFVLFPGVTFFLSAIIQ